MSKEIEYKKKIANFIGYDHMGAARRELCKLIILNLLNELGMNMCYRCGQKITDSKQLSLDHMIPWRSGKTQDEAAKLFSDIENISPAHFFCNVPDSNRGKNKCGFVGIGVNNRGTYCSKVYIESKPIIVGYSKNPKIAAFFYDLATVKYRDGCGQLNFEYLREYYKTVKDREWRLFSDDEITALLPKGQ